jgi:hypothetical protein
LLRNLLSASVGGVCAFFDAKKFAVQTNPSTAASPSESSLPVAAITDDGKAAEQDDDNFVYQDCDVDDEEPPIITSREEPNGEHVDSDTLAARFVTRLSGFVVYDRFATTNDDVSTSAWVTLD